MSDRRRSNNIRYAWVLTGTLFFCAALNYGDRTAVSSVFPLLERDFGMSDVGLAAIGSLFLWSYAFGSPFSGLLADRVSRRRVVLYSLVAWSLVTGLTAFVPSGKWLLFARVLLGLSECLYLPAAIAMIADYHPVSTRATAMAIHVAGLNAGMVAGGTVGGYVGEHFGWRAVFLVFGGAGLALAVLCNRILQDRLEPVENETAELEREAPAAMLESLRRILTVPTYLFIVAEAMLVSVGTWIFANWLPLYFAETFHMNLASAGFSGTFTIQAAGVIGTVLGGAISDAAARRHVHWRMLVQFICLLAAAPFLLNFIWSRSFLWISLSIFFYQLLAGMSSTNEHPILCDVLDSKLRSTAIGCMNTTSCLAGGAGILIVGILKRSFGLGAIFGYAAGTVFVAAFLILICYLFFLQADLAERAATGAPTPAPVSL